MSLDGQISTFFLSVLTSADSFPSPSLELGTRPSPGLNEGAFLDHPLFSAWGLLPHLLGGPQVGSL